MSNIYKLGDYIIQKGEPNAVFKVAFIGASIWGKTVKSRRLFGFDHKNIRLATKAEVASWVLDKIGG